MKRIIFSGLYILTFLLLFAACQENEQMEFGQKPSAYFSSLTAADSMAYAFASGKVKQDTVLIPVKIIGESTSYDRKIAVSYTHLTLPTTQQLCRSRWSPYH